MKKKQIGSLICSMMMIILWNHCTEETRYSTTRLSIMTYNILCSYCDPSFDPWSDRIYYIQDTINRYDPNIIGMQELMTYDEVILLKDLFRSYEDYCYEDYPDATIFYKTDKYVKLDQGNFWLSPNPDIPFSTGFSDSYQLPRLVVWIKLKDVISNNQFYFFNTHFDNNPPSQDLSADLVLEKIPTIAVNQNIIFAGDFNSQTYDSAYKTLIGIESQADFYFENSYDITSEKDRGINTNVDPIPEYSYAGRIDHIFVFNGNFVGKNWKVDLYKYGPNRKYPSDHFPIYADIEF